MKTTQDPFDEFYATLRTLDISMDDWKVIAEAAVKLGQAKYKQGTEMVKEVYDL